MTGRRGNEGLEQMRPKSRDLAFAQNPFLVEAHQVEHLVEGVLLPLQVIGLHLLELVLRGRQAPLLEGEGQYGLAEGGDGVMERGVVRGGVRLRHVCEGGGVQRKDRNLASFPGSRSSFDVVRE